MTTTEQIVLTFPDGTDVRTIPDLDRWLEMVMAEPGVPESERQFAARLVAATKAKLN